MNANNDTAPAWFADAITEGLKVLYPLRLDGAPPAETLGATADTWETVLWHIKHWDETRDKQDIKRAFIRLAGRVERWPAPRQLMDCLTQTVAPIRPVEQKHVSEDAKRRGFSSLAQLLNDPALKLHRTKKSGNGENKL